MTAVGYPEPVETRWQRHNRHAPWMDRETWEHWQRHRRHHMRNRHERHQR